MPSPRVPEITPEEFKDRLARGDRVALLDVREDDEVQAWPFPGSIHVPLGEVLRGELGGLPFDQEVVTTCAHGNRSAVAAEFLLQRGIAAKSLRGGIAGWSQVYDTASIPLDGNAQVVQVRRLGKGCVGYLVVAGGTAAVIDPSRHTDQYARAAAAAGATIRHVVDTHLHADHLSGARQLAEETGAALHLNPAEQYAFDGFGPVRDGDVIPVGSLRLAALAAPGHTAGSLAWNIDGRALATGDVLFLESVGRPDLHGHAEAYARDLFHTLARLAVLPPHLLILPAHMPEGHAMTYGKPHVATLGEVRARVGLGREDEETFVARTSRVPERPPNMVAILEANRYGRRLPVEEADVLEEGPNRCAVKVSP